MTEARKYRAKCLSTRQWVYGYYFYKWRTQQHVIHCDESTGVMVDREIEVDPDTLGAIATVRGGQTYYQGDFVLVKGRRRGGDYITEICDGRQGGFALRKNMTYLNDDSAFLAIQKHLGNKYDNPEIAEKVSGRN